MFPENWKHSDDLKRAQAWTGLPGKPHTGTPHSCTSLRAQPVPYLHAAYSQAEQDRPRQQVFSPCVSWSCLPQWALLVHRNILGPHCLLVAAAVACGRSDILQVMQPHVQRLQFYCSMCPHAVCYPVLPESCALVPLRWMEGGMGLRL